MPVRTTRRLSPRRLSLLLSLAPCLLATQNVCAQTTAANESSDDIIDYVIVTGSQVSLPPDYAGGQVARGGRVGLFGNLDMMDTPFNSTNYTAEFMRNLQAHSVADVVQSDPGVRVARGFGNFQELYVVRGFPVYSDDMSYNGLYGLLPRQYVAAEFLERVEVFRGANSFLNGAAPGGSGIGGSFNLVPKRAPDRDLNRVTLGAENGGEMLGAADFARRFGDDGEFGIRANAVRRDGETSVDDQERQLSMFSLGMDYRGANARLSADVGYQDHNIDAPRPSVTPLSTIPRAPDASSNFAQDWTFSSEKDFFGVARGEYDFTDAVSGWLAAGFRDGEEHNSLANPTAAPNGDATTYLFDNYREDRVTTGDAGLRFEFDTGAVGHRIATSVSYFKLDSKNAYALSTFGALATNIYNPVQVARPTPVFFGGVLFSPRTTSKSETTSVALADTLSFSDDKLLVTVGGRYQIIEQYSYDYGNGAELSGYDESTITPVFGVVLKPWENISLYANYIEGLLQGEEVPTTVNEAPVSNAGEIFEPFKSKQYEVGAKYDGGTVGGTVAVFRISQPSTVLVGNTVVEDGEQRNQGIELSVYGQLSNQLRLLGGVTFLDAENRRGDLPANDGKDVIGVPETQANIGVDWDLPLAGLSTDARVVYTSSQAADAGNTLEIPSWTRLDLGARYQVELGKRLLTLRGRVDNVTDKNYWGSVGGSFGANYLVLGAPRTFIISASFDF